MAHLKEAPVFLEVLDLVEQIENCVVDRVRS
jgi:hypothetical protein